MITYIRKHLQSSLYQNTYLIILIRIFGMGFGFIFWALAARLMETVQVGIASGVVAAASLLAGLAQLGLGFGLVQFLPKKENAVDLLNFSLLLSAMAGGILSIVFLVGLPFWSRELLTLRSSYMLMLVFMGLVSSTALSQLVHYALLAKRRLNFSLFKSLAQAILAILFLILFQNYTHNSTAAIGAYFLATLISFLATLIWFLPIAHQGYQFMPSIHVPGCIELTRFSVLNHIPDQAQRLPDTLLPLIVIAQLGAEAGAYFFIIWTLGRSIAAWSGSVGESLFAEGSHSPADAHQHGWKAMKFGLLLAFVMAAAVSTFGRFVLAIYGAEYVNNGLNLLYCVAFAAVPGVVLTILINMLRIQNRMGAVSVIMLASAGLGIAASYFGMSRYGLVGAGIGWLTMQLLLVGTVTLWWYWKVIVMRPKLQPI